MIFTYLIFFISSFFVSIRGGEKQKKEFKMKKLISNQNKILNLTTEDYVNSYNVNSSLFSVIERATLGSITALYELCIAHKKGDKVNKDLEIASLFALEIMYFLEKENRTIDNAELYIQILLEYALIEKERENYEIMKESFNDVVSNMQKFIPIEKWDYSIFEIIEQSMKESQLLN